MRVWPNGGCAIMFFNMQRKPWDDIRVRRAVDLAIDRQATINVLGQGTGIIAYAYPSDSPFALPDQEVKSWPGYRQPKDEVSAPI